MKNLLNIVVALALIALVIAGCTGGRGDSADIKLARAESAQQSKNYSLAIQLAQEVTGDLSATAEQKSEAYLILAQSKLGRMGFSSMSIIAVASKAVFSNPLTGDVAIDSAKIFAQLPPNATAENLGDAADTYNNLSEFQSLYNLNTKSGVTKNYINPVMDENVLLNAAVANFAAALKVFTKHFEINSSDTSVIMRQKIHLQFASDPNTWNEIGPLFTKYITNATTLLKQIVKINPRCAQEIKDATNNLRPSYVQMDKINKAIPQDQEGMIIKMLISITD